MLKLEEKTVKQEILYQGKIINLRKDLALLENGNTAVREIVEHSGGVCVAALTEQNELLFVRQFRYPYQKVLLELPAGKRNPGEDPLACGKRELKEVVIAPEAVDPEDVEMLQDMIVAAVNEALRAAESDSASTMQQLTGGLGLPF